MPTLHETTVESKLISSSQSKHSGSHSKNNGCNLLLHKLFTHRFYDPSLEREIIHKPTRAGMNRNTEHNAPRPASLPFSPSISKQMFCDEPQSLPSFSDGNSKRLAYTDSWQSRERINYNKKSAGKDESRNLVAHGKSLNV